MVQEVIFDKTAFSAGKIAALIGRKDCPYPESDRIKVFSWRRGWADGAADRVLNARALSHPDCSDSDRW